MRFTERYRAMRSRWNRDWWSIAFGGPVGNLLTAVIADVRWITPNGITWLSFLCKLAAAPLIVFGGYDVLVVVLFQLHTVLDCMDGTLARYRKKPSVMGAFLDKVTDMIGLLAIMTAFGWRAGVETADARLLAASILIAGALLLRSYVFWVVAHFEREHEVQKPTAGDQRKDFSTLTIGERFRMYVKWQWTVIEFAEADLYFWLSLGLLLDELRYTILGLAIAVGAWTVLIIGKRYWTIHQIDRRKRTNSY
jgi:phosphatidylglycerophosphate synthase